MRLLFAVAAVAILAIAMTPTVLATETSFLVIQPASTWGDGVGSTGSFVYKIGQTFNATADYGINLSRVESNLKYWLGDDTSDLYLIVENYSGTPTNDLTGSPIKGCIGMVPTFTTAAAANVSFNLSNCQLQGNHNYTVVINTTRATTGGRAFLAGSTAADAYVNGSGWWYRDGSGWTIKAVDMAMNFFNFTSPTFYVFGLNLTVLNAWTSAGESSYNVQIGNDTFIFNNLTVPTSNFVWNFSDIPQGDLVNITIYKTGYTNITYYELSINGSAMLNLTVHIVKNDDFIHIINPTNTTYFNPSISYLFITPAIYGNMFELKYSLDGANTTVNTSSSIWSGSVTNTYGVHFLKAYALNTSFNSEYTANVSYSVHYSQVNINIMDEMTGGWLDLAGKNASIQVVCPDYANWTQLSSASTTNFTLSCSSPFVSIFINDSSTWGLINQFRTQVPGGGTGNLTFYMINTSSSRPVYYTVHISDYLGTWSGALMNITKAVPSKGNQIITSQHLDSSGNVNTYLIDGQKYTITLISSDGMQIRTTGDLLVSYLTTTTSISMLSLPLIPVNREVPTFEFTCSLPTSTVGIVYIDSSNATTQLTLSVNDVVNGSVLYTNTVGFNGTVYAISWNGVPINKSVLLEIAATSSTFGIITNNQVCYFSPVGRAIELGIEESWYVPIAIFLIIIMALIFSAWNATVGGVVTLMFAGMLWAIGWLPSVYAAVLFLGVIIIIFARFRKGEIR